MIWGGGRLAPGVGWALHPGRERNGPCGSLALPQAPGEGAAGRLNRASARGATTRLFRGILTSSTRGGRGWESERKRRGRGPAGGERRRAAAACPAPRGGRTSRGPGSVAGSAGPRAGGGWCARSPASRSGGPAPDLPGPRHLSPQPPPQTVYFILLFTLKSGAALNSGKGLFLWVVVQFRSIATSA